MTILPPLDKQIIDYLLVLRGTIKPHYMYMRGTHLHEPGVQVSDFEWCLTDNAETQERGRFFLIILNLATIEVRDYLYFLRLPPPSLCR